MEPATFLPSTALLSLCWFAAIASITPGPNNIMLAAAGVNFGVRATFPQMAGISAGLILATAAAGLGLGTLFSEYPALREVLKFAGVLYILYLSWRIATAGSLGAGELPHPMRFGATLGLQGANVKLWTAAIATVALYVRPGHTLADTAVVTLAFALINLPAMFVWAGGGAGLREALKRPARIRAFNIVMGLALAISVLPLLWSA